MKKDTIITICASLLILLFLYTAVYKLAGYQTYVDSMNAQPLPKWSLPLLIRIIPSAEVLASLLLFFPWGRFWGFLLSMILMMAFTGYVALVLVKAFGRIPCTCGGAIQSLNWSQHLTLNIVFLVIAVVGLVLCYKRTKTTQIIAARQS